MCKNRENIISKIKKPLSLADNNTNQKEAIRELLTIRADNEEAKLRMLNEIDKNGKVSYKDCKVSLDQSQSLQTMKVFITGACLRTDGLTQKHKPIDDE